MDKRAVSRFLGVHSIDGLMYALFLASRYVKLFRAFTKLRIPGDRLRKLLNYTRPAADAAHSSGYLQAPLTGYARDSVWTQ